MHHYFAQRNDGIIPRKFIVNGRMGADVLDLSTMSSGKRQILVKLAHGATVIRAVPWAAIGGTLVGDGPYIKGRTATLVAYPNAGYYFAGWLENGVWVCGTPVYKFKVKKNRSLVATFAPAGYSTIPAGTFQMGNALSASVTGGANEVPVHAVNVSSYFMQTTPVQKWQWDTVVGWGLAHGYTDLMSSGTAKPSNHPVVAVNWFDVVKWCNAKSEMDGLVPCYSFVGVYRTGSSNYITCNWAANGYRLPTEAEWEKAARGGLIGQQFPWGNTISQMQANFYSSGYQNYDISPEPGGEHPAYSSGDYPFTSPVGAFAPNGFGLYDMAGNVSEWCWDWENDSYYWTSPSVDPTGPVAGTNRVLRGGSWDRDASSCRVSARSSTPPSYYGYYYYSDYSYYWDYASDCGFRCVRK